MCPKSIKGDFVQFAVKSKVNGYILTLIVKTSSDSDSLTAMLARVCRRQKSIQCDTEPTVCWIPLGEDYPIFYH